MIGMCFYRHFGTAKIFFSLSGC